MVELQAAFLTFSGQWMNCSNAEISFFLAALSSDVRVICNHRLSDTKETTMEPILAGFIFIAVNVLNIFVILCLVKVTVEPSNRL